MLNQLDFVLKINAEARQGLGEDSWCYGFSPELGMIAAFDGCGGSGARKHEFYSGHSEAYMASRLGAGALFDAFLDDADRKDSDSPEAILNAFSGYCRNSFTLHRPPAAQTAKIRSSMIATLPTTMAAAFLRTGSQGVEITAAWAGDSRIYVLTRAGLSQLSLDDADENDPFETDGMMNNTLNADREPRINRNRCVVSLPAVVFAATDGCFAYYTTPMEFEGVLLSTLLSSSSPAEWEALLNERIGKVAGDDYTLSMAAIGFGSFGALKQYFSARYAAVYEQYLQKIDALDASDTDGRRALWDSYKSEYMKYLQG